MKKYILMVLVMAVVMTFAGVSAAAAAENVVSDDLLKAEAAEAGVVGEDIEIGEGEMKIVSLPVDEGEGGGSDTVDPVAPEELLMEEQARVDAANEVGVDGDHTGAMTPDEDGDASVSITADELTEQELQELADLAAQSGVVGDGIEVAEGEAKIVSMPDVVGEDIEIGDDMAKIVSVEEEAPFNWPLAAGIAGGVVVLGGVIFLLIKKSNKPVTAA